MVAVPCLVVGSVLAVACAFYPDGRRHGEALAASCGIVGALLIAVGLWRLT